MNRWICAVIGCVLCLSLTATAANGAATNVYTTKAPAYELLLTTENSAVGVTRETVRFDFPSFEEDGASSAAKITAEYQLSNPVGEATSVSVALPIVTDFRSAHDNKVSLQADGKTLDYSLVLGDTAEYGESSVASYLMDSYRKAIFRATEFSSAAFQEEADVYAVTVQPQEDSFELVVTMNVDLQKNQLVYYGFRACQYDGNRTVRLSATIGKDSVPLGFAVWGDESSRSQPVFSYYTDVNWTTSLSDLGAFFTQRQADLPQLIRWALKQYPFTNSESALDDRTVALDSPQAYDLVAPVIDEALTKEGVASLDQSISTCLSTERIAFYCYTLPFSGGEIKQVSLQYEIEGTMDQRSTDEPLYRYEYEMESANQWPFYGGLTLVVAPPARAPYVVDSEPSLTEQGDGSYQVFLTGIPEDAVTFSLHASEAGSAGRVENSRRFSIAKIVVYIFLFLLAASMIHLVIFMLRNKYKRAKRRNK